MAKYKLGPGQGLSIGPYTVCARSRGVRIVPLSVPHQIQVVRSEPRPGCREYLLSPRQSIVLPGGGRLLSDSRHAVEIAIWGPEGELVDRTRFPRTPVAEARLPLPAAG